MIKCFYVKSFTVIFIQAQDCFAMYKPDTMSIIIENTATRSQTSIWFVKKDKENGYFCSQKYLS